MINEILYNNYSAAECLLNTIYPFLECCQRSYDAENVAQNMVRNP